MLDLVIKNARVIDGTDSPWFRADVGIKDGFIAAVGKISEDAKEYVDAEDNYLTPGFIDIHSHSDDGILEHPQNESRILQGVTTELCGNCGDSLAPNEKGLTMAEFLDTVEKAQPSTNFAMLVGHGTVRAIAMGYDDREPSEEELEKMRSLVRESMQGGAYGISTGLIYPPGSYAKTDELIEVVKAVRDYDGFYATHMRGEGKPVISSTKEAIEIATKAGVPLEISHHKVTYKPDWQVSCFMTTALIERARRNGLEVTCDQYPYRASATSLSIDIPAWAFNGGVSALMERLKNEETRALIRDQMNASHIGRWGDIVVSYVSTEKNAWMAGMSIEAIAEKLGKDPADTLMDAVIEENNHIGELDFDMCEEDIEHIMKRPYTMTGSDGSAMSLNRKGKPHPRNYGTFVRVLSHYCRDRQLFPIETAVHKMTSLPASRLRLSDRGIIKQGMRADLVLFNLNKLNDNPSFTNPQQACDGIMRVYVNGVLTAKDGAHTGARAGMVLRHKA